MNHFEIVAHRGIPSEAPENTIASFQRAIELGLDAVELDVRLTADRIPIVFHNVHLQDNTSASGVIFEYTWEQLREVKVYCPSDPGVPAGHISTLFEILELFGGRLGLEIEIKGPEPEAPEAIGQVLNHFRPAWDSIEMTSSEPAFLLAIQDVCPGITADLLFPRSEGWMTPDVVQYQAIHFSRLARARAVHLHPTQLSETIVAALRQHGIETHAWEVNDEPSLMTVARLGIPRLCTDLPRQALVFREHNH